MIHIAISVLISIVVTAIFAYSLGGSVTAIGVGILPGLIAGGAFFIWRVRVVSKDMEVLMQEMQAILSAPATPRTVQQRDAIVRKRIQKSIKILEKGYKWKGWHPGIVGQIDGQIGTLLYVDGQNIPATDYLSRASSRNWVARAMYACVAYRRNQVEEMKKIFESALRWSKKEALLWNTYAWCVWKKGDVDEAIDILNRAQKHVKTDERTAENLNALRNGRAMKMDAWGQEWAQFRLDDSYERQQQAAAQPQPRMDRRSMYRGR